MPVFHLDDTTALIRTQDVLEAAKGMARKLGMIAEVRVVVGRYQEDGQMTGWSAQCKDDEEDLLLEVFVSKLGEEQREFDRYAREMQAVLDENARLKAQLASVGRNPTGEDRKDGLRAEEADDDASIR